MRLLRFCRNGGGGGGGGGGCACGGGGGDLAGCWVLGSGCNNIVTIIIMIYINMNHYTYDNTYSRT